MNTKHTFKSMEILYYCFEDPFLEIRKRIKNTPVAVRVRERVESALPSTVWSDG